MLRDMGINVFRSCRPRRLGALAAVAAAAVLVACDETPNTTIAAEALTELEADGVIYGMDDYMETEGIRSGRIKADSAHVFNDSSVIHLWNLDMVLYHEDGRERATITAERGTLHQRSNKMVARGDVVAQMAASPERIESPELHYDPSRDQIWSDSTTVRVLPTGQTTRGSCFRSDLELRNWTICDVRGAAGAPGGGGG